MNSLKKSLIFVLVLVVVLAAAFKGDLSRAIPLLPPLLAIGLAFTTRNVLLSLFFGTYIGALALIDFSDLGTFITAAGAAVLRVGDTYVLNAIADKDYAANILFILAIGGTVGVITKSGGIEGVVEKITKFAKTARSTQIVTWLLGIVFFVDDYANTLVVGSTMRPITDRFKISREKLAFLIDATAAPVASLAPISTWIAYEVGLIDEALKAAEVPSSAYLMFLDSLWFRFYAVFLLFFIFFLIIQRRDFGPMYDAERRARDTGAVLRPGSTPLIGKELEEIDIPEHIPKRWFNAVVPLVVMVLTILIGFYTDGYLALKTELGAAVADAPLRDVLGSANPFLALMWGSITCSIVAIVMTVSQKIATMESAMNAWVSGVKSMVLAVIILCFAWALSGVVKELKTAQLITEITKDFLIPQLIPTVVFVVALVMAFATGTSWGTMAVLFPITVPLVVKLSALSNLADPTQMMLLTASVGAILTGAIFGDHISPLSDTTIMSSMWAAVDHMDHVRTQIPYALVVGGIAIVFGYLPAGFGVHPAILTVIALPVMWIVVRKFGKRIA